MWQSYVTGFILAAIFITLLIISNVTLSITTGVADSQKISCLDSCNEDLAGFPEDLQRCINECNKITDASTSVLTENRFFNFFLSLSILQITLIIMGLFVTGFFVGWGITLLVRLGKK